MYAYCVTGTMWNALWILLHWFHRTWDRYNPILHLKKLRLTELGTQLLSTDWAGVFMHWSYLWHGTVSHSALLSLSCWQTKLSPIPQLGVESQAQTWVPFPGFLRQKTNLWSCYLWSIVCFPDAECGWSCQHARKHLAGQKEGKKSIVHVCCQLFKIGQLPQTVKTYSSLNTYKSL